jgi:archaemetzincin
VKALNDIKVPDPAAFPGPLVLPSDDLAYDPTYPPQSLRSWVREKDRNPVGEDRRTVYVAAPPDVSSEVSFIKDWAVPTVETPRAEMDAPTPRVGDVARYLEAFYRGLDIKILPPEEGLRFVAWDGDEEDVSVVEIGEGDFAGGGDDSVVEISEELFCRGRKGKVKAKSKSTPASKAKSKRKPPKQIALQTPTEAIKIRTRPSPAPAQYSHQLNLNDVLDAVLAILPSNAYSIL